MRHRSWRPALARASIAGATMGVTIIALSVPAMAAPATTPNGCSNSTPASSNPNCPGATTSGGGGTGGSNNGNNGNGGGNNTNNPPGNNGTVKIHNPGTPADDNANEPHVGCTFVTDYIGFDANQSLTPAFAAQPPSGTGQDLLKDNVITLTSGNIPFTTDSKGCGTQTWNFSPAEATFWGLTYQPQQGYHVKLTVSTGQPGANGVKHKVFWVKCGTTTPPGGNSPTLSVCKSGDTTNGAVIGPFTFTLTRSGQASGTSQQVAVGQCGSFPVVAGDSYTLAEAPNALYEVKSITSTDLTLASAGTGAVTFTVPNIAGNRTLVVNVVNERVSGTAPQTATLRTCKVAATGTTIPGSVSFPFTVRGVASFPLHVTDCNDQTVDPSTAYTVTETPNATYPLKDVTIGTVGSLGTVDLSVGSAAVTTGGPGTTTVLTFVNRGKSTPPTTPPGSGGSTPGGVTTPVVTPPVVGHPPATTPPGTQVSPVKVVTSTPSTQVLGEKFIRSATPQVRPQVGATQATTLPFTGASNTGALLTSGLGALFGGGLLMLAGRKRRTA